LRVAYDSLRGLTSGGGCHSRHGGRRPAIHGYVAPNKESRGFHGHGLDGATHRRRCNVQAGLEMRPPLAHSPVMDAITAKTPPGWVTEALERSEAQIEFGQTVQLEPVLDRLRASIARMKAGQKRASPKTVREE
jgi:hypothetical protein